MTILFYIYIYILKKHEEIRNKMKNKYNKIKIWQNNQMLEKHEIVKMKL